MLLDTNVISLAYKGHEKEVGFTSKPYVISSVVASEFLEFFDRKGQLDYYIFYSKLVEHLIFYSGHKSNEKWGNGKWARGHRHFSDEYIVEMGKDYPRLLYPSNLTVTVAINEKRTDLFRFCISHLPKEKQKRILARFRFLCSDVCRCIPLRKEAGELAQECLIAFSENGGKVKKDFRNSFNDLLILASAVIDGLELVTNDSVLSSFAAAYFRGNARQESGYLRVKFESPAPDSRRHSLESKGYVNRGWQVKLLRERY